MASYTTLWTADQVRRVRRAGLVGQPIAMTFGGPHLSAPRFSRAGVTPGHEVIPIQVRDGRLMLLARLHVQHIMSAEAFVGAHPDVFEPISNHREFRRIESALETPRSRAFWLLRIWIESDPAIDAVCRGEADEVLTVDRSTPVRLDVVASPESVLALRWQSRRQPERAIRHLTEDGRIEKSITLQGIYRLTDDSAARLQEAMA